MRKLSDAMSQLLTLAVSEHNGTIHGGTSQQRQGLLSRDLVEWADGGRALRVTDAGRAIASPEIPSDGTEQVSEGREPDGTLSDDQATDEGPVDVDSILATVPADDPGPDPWGGANLEPAPADPGMPDRLAAVVRAIREGGYGGTARGIVRDHPQRGGERSTRWVSRVRHALYVSGCDKAGDALQTMGGA